MVNVEFIIVVLTYRSWTSSGKVASCFCSSATPRSTPTSLALVTAYSENNVMSLGRSSDARRKWCTAAFRASGRWVCNHTSQWCGACVWCVTWGHQRVRGPFAVSTRWGRPWDEMTCYIFKLVRGELSRGDLLISSHCKVHSELNRTFSQMLTLKKSDHEAP